MLLRYTTATLAVLAGLLSCGDPAPVSPLPCPNCPVPSLIDGTPSWSPDGTQIAFDHFDSSVSKAGIYLLTLATSEASLFIAGPDASYPAWAPNGQWIAFAKDGEIWKKGVLEDTLVQLTDSDGNFQPTWSPDGKRIAYVSDDDSPNGVPNIWKMRSDGSSKMRIGYDASGGSIMPSWNSENLIVHIRNILGTSTEIFTMDSLGGNVVRVTVDNSTDSTPMFSEIADRIVFISNVTQPAVSLIRVDGTGSTILVDQPSFTCAWSPDGTTVAYMNVTSGNGRLWLVNSDGSNRRQITYASMF